MFAIADLSGSVGTLAFGLTFWVALGVGYLRLGPLLSKLGHADKDLRVLNKQPPSCLGRIPWFLKIGFTSFCSFMQSFQLQSSKVSKDYKQKVQFILNFDRIYFSYKYLTNLKNVPVKNQYSGLGRAAMPKPKPPTLLYGEPVCSHPSPALKVRNTTKISRYLFAQPYVCPRLSVAMYSTCVHAIGILNI